MSKLQEIKDQVAQEYGYSSFEHYDDAGTFIYDHNTPEIIDKIARRYAKVVAQSVAEDALKRAAENARTRTNDESTSIIVDKQSILSTPINTDL